MKFRFGVINTFHWKTAVHIHLRIVCGSFCATTAELGSCSNDLVLQKA